MEEEEEEHPQEGVPFENKQAPLEERGGSDKTNIVMIVKARSIPGSLPN